MSKKVKEINIKVELDVDNLPESIKWRASDSPKKELSEAKCMMLSFWDKDESNTLKIDLWVKDMPVDEMHTHYLQTLMSLTESYFRATGNNFIRDKMLNFCQEVAQDLREQS